jgi:hypothetical protein
MKQSKAVNKTNSMRRAPGATVSRRAPAPWRPKTSPRSRGLSAAAAGCREVEARGGYLNKHYHMQEVQTPAFSLTCTRWYVLVTFVLGTIVRLGNFISAQKCAFWSA